MSGISFSSKIIMCTLVEITQNLNEPTFQVTMKDSFNQPIFEGFLFSDISKNINYMKIELFEIKCSIDLHFNSTKTINLLVVL